MATLYEQTMKEVLGKLDHVDEAILWGETVEKVNDMSAAITPALAEIEGFEGNFYRHGSIATLLEVKRILLGATK